MSEQFAPTLQELDIGPASENPLRRLAEAEDYATDFEAQKAAVSLATQKYHKYNQCLLRAEAIPADAWMRRMLDALQERFLFAPASSREEYHGAYRGGLVVHVVSVFEHAVRLRDVRGIPPSDISQRTLWRVALLHDLGKLGSLDQEYYSDQKAGWKLDRGWRYEINKDRSLVAMSIPARAIWLCLQFQVQLTAEEMQAVLYSDGAYVPEHDHVRNKEHPLQMLLHHADAWVSQIIRI